MHDGTNDIIALEADEAFMARLSTPRGSNSVAQSETRRTGLAQMLTRRIRRCAGRSRREFTAEISGHVRTVEMWLASRHEIGRAKLRVSFGAAVSMQAIRDCPLRPAEPRSIMGRAAAGSVRAACGAQSLLERRSVSIGLLPMCDAALSRGNCKAHRSPVLSLSGPRHR